MRESVSLRICFARGESVGALFSSEVTFTQEMTFWEGGEQHSLDAGERDDAADPGTLGQEGAA